MGTIIRHSASHQACDRTLNMGSKVKCPRRRNSWASTCWSSAPDASSRAATSLQRTSLIPETLQTMEQDSELQQVLRKLETMGQEAVTKEEKRQRKRSLKGLGVASFQQKLEEAGVGSLTRSTTRILQLNVGLYCNQACTHCHVESSPKRTEAMDEATIQRCAELMDSCPTLTTLDLTGGAPEYHPFFRLLVKEGRQRGLEVIDRCNLTVLLEPGMEDLPQFLADHQVRVVASLPCYSASNVDKQRGAGVFERSIDGLKLLNQVGYGQEGSGLQLDLVYNPGGVFLAPAQKNLEVAYKSELSSAYGIHFNSLLALNNMPIKRFADSLIRMGKLDEYMQLLVNSFNPSTADGLMCRDTVSVSWDGIIYDCDFNQQLAIAMRPPAGSPAATYSQSAGRPTRPTIFDITSLSDTEGWGVVVDSHCYGCTAGAGSSCQGATA